MPLNHDLTHKDSLLVACILSLFIQSNWFYENFRSKADFYDSIPITIPFLAYLLVSGTLGAFVCEGAIRFVKRYM